MELNTLIVDTNFSSAPIYDYLSNQGHRVYVIGNNPNDYLAVISKNYINSDYTKHNLLLNAVDEYDIDYVIPGCNDHSYEACSMLNDHICNIDDYKTNHILMNKSKFRQFSHDNNISIPAVFSQMDVLKINKPTELIVKPVDSFSGKGITKVISTDKSSLEEAIKIARGESRKNEYLIEEFIEGQLYSHSAFIEDQSILQDFFVQEHGSVNPFVVDTSYVLNDFPKEIGKGIQKEIEKISTLLKLSDGLVHTQFIVNDGKFWLIEITRRCPGDLYSKLINLSTGFDYSGNYAKKFIGQSYDKVKLKSNYQSVIRHTITTNKTGWFEYLSFKVDLALIDFHIFKRSGSHIEPSPKGRIGVLFANAGTIEELSRLLNKFISRLVYQIKLKLSNES